MFVHSSFLKKLAGRSLMFIWRTYTKCSKTPPWSQSVFSQGSTSFPLTQKKWEWAQLYKYCRPSSQLPWGSQAGYTCDVKFTNIGLIVEFMPIMYRWFVQMDVSNRQQHIHLNNRDARGFSDSEDARLYWLELSVLGYTEHLKEASSQDNFPSKETYHALMFNAVSNVQYIKFIFNECSFQFVHTPKFSTDPTKSFLGGFMRWMASYNEVAEVRSAVCGPERTLKIGTASQKSNVSSCA